VRFPGGAWFMKRLRKNCKGEGGSTNRYLPVVLVCTRFILHLISTTLQSSQAFLPVKQLCLTSNIHRPTCNFWPLRLLCHLALLRGICLCLEKTLFSSSWQAFCSVCLLYLSSEQDRRSQGAETPFRR